MQARVKADCHIDVVRACAGREYVKYEWRVVPEDQEHDPPNNPLLEWREGPASDVRPAVEPEPASPATVEEALAGTVADVRAFVAKVADPDDLLRMQELELTGKGRQGALDAIEARLAQLNAEVVER